MSHVTVSIPTRLLGKSTIIFVIRACLIHDSELAYGSVWCDDRHGFAHTSVSFPTRLLGKSTMIFVIHACLIRDSKLAYGSVW